MKCEICGRKAESRFCEFHEMAYKNLLRVYDQWREAMDISWERYLHEILKNPNTGIWVKEVAKKLISEEKEE